MPGDPKAASFSSEVGKIKEGMPLDISIGAVEDKRFKGKLEHIAPKGQLVEGAIQFEIKAAMEPIAGAVEGVKDFLGIASPSKLMRQIGEWTGEGMAIGLDDSASLVARASGGLEPALPRSSYVQAPNAAQIDGGGLRVKVVESGSSAGGPLIGSLTMQSAGDAQSDIGAIVYGLRKFDRGGRV